MARIPRVLLVAASALVLAVPAAEAHKPLFSSGSDGATNSSAHERDDVGDANVSWAVYGRFAAAGDTHVVRGRLDEGQVLLAQVLVPDASPERGMPAAQLPQLEVTWPDGTRHDVPLVQERSRFHEPITGTDYLTVASLRRDAPQAGGYQWRLVARAPGRYVIAIGTREAFGLGDVLQLPATVKATRAWAGAGEMIDGARSGRPGDLLWDQRTVAVEAVARSITFVAALMLALWLLALVIRDNSIADVAWGPGFLLVAVASITAAPDVTLRASIVTAVVGVWALRLAVHILRRKLREHGEDWRYASWRTQWGRLWPLRSLLQVFVLQGLLMLVAATPIIVVASAPPVRGVWATAALIVGASLWVVGFVIEVVADAQLDAYRQRKAAGESMPRFISTGLWGRSRHPNYLGEAMLWWGIAIIVLPVDHGWIGLIGAATVNVLVRFVSGVPILERRWAGITEWEEYAAATPVFVPWPSRQRSRSPQA